MLPLLLLPLRLSSPMPLLLKVDGSRRAPSVVGDDGRVTCGVWNGVDSLLANGVVRRLGSRLLCGDVRLLLNGDSRWLLMLAVPFFDGTMSCGPPTSSRVVKKNLVHSPSSAQSSCAPSAAAMQKAVCRPEPVCASDCMENNGAVAVEICDRRCTRACRGGWVRCEV
jgi:hypothetical protein